jgi:hypothetical protein
MNKKDTQKDILERMRTDMTDLDIQRYLPETNSPQDNLMKYSELADVNSIYDILPYDRSYKIILVESEYSKGHFVAILRYGNTIEQFDSYSKKIDDELSFVSNLQKKLLGQDKKYLTHLLKKLPKKVKKIYNKKRLQKLVNNSATCGRFVILRIILMKDFGFNLQQYQDFLERWCKKTGLNADELVALMIK